MRIIVHISLYANIFLARAIFAGISRPLTHFATHV